MTNDEHVPIDEHWTDDDSVVCAVCKARKKTFNTRDVVFTFEHLKRKALIHICNDCVYELIEKLIQYTKVGCRCRSKTMFQNQKLTIVDENNCGEKYHE